MNIAVDIDDTLTDSFDYFLPFVAEFFGAEAEELKKRNISYSNLPEECKNRELEFCKKYYDKIVENTPFKKDAANAVSRLKAAGHKIIVITGRTKDFYTDPYKTTEKELQNGNILYDKLVCTLDKKKACKAEKIELLIDDMPANCKAAAEAGIPALLFTSKANAKESVPFPRAENWEEALSFIANLSERVVPPEQSEPHPLAER